MRTSVLYHWISVGRLSAARLHQPAAAEALDMIARLFAIETAVKGKPPAERVAARRERAIPLLNDLRAFLDTTLAKISGKKATSPGPSATRPLAGRP